VAEAVITLAVFFGLTTMITLPLAVLVGAPLLAWTLRSWLRLRERELDLRRLEVAEKLRLLRLADLPAWVDPSDPDQLLAWTLTDRELAVLERPVA